MIAEQLSDIDQQEVFVAGLLQSIGQLIFASTIPGGYEKMLSDASDTPEAIDQEDMEQRWLGLTCLPTMIFSNR